MEKENIKSYVEKSKRYPLLSHEQEMELSLKVQNGDAAAQQQLILSNLRLVISIARKYYAPNLSLMDLIQEGNLGLTVAASKYHYSFNTRFSTYAYAWISQYIARYIQTKSPFIAIPFRKEEMLRHIKNAHDYLFQQSGRKPSSREIAEYLDVPIKMIRNAQRYSYNVTSLNMDIDSSPSLTLIDTIPDVQFAPETYISRMADSMRAVELLNLLPPVERKVVYYRYHFDGGQQKKTLREIGEMLGISAETVRQTELRAIRRLRKICTENNNAPEGLSA
jgi:RNA polymerase primary sigma factor